VCLSVCLCVSVRLYVSTFLNGSSPHLEGTIYGSWHVPWAIYVLCVRNVRARACVLSARTSVHSLICERILSKLAGNILRLTISGKDYVLLIVTHRTHACERTCARARVIKRSLIYGRIIFKIAVNILQVTSSSMGYVFIFKHRTRAWLKHSIIFGRILFKFDGHILQMTTSYMWYILIMFKHCVHACTDSLQIVYHIPQISRGCMIYLMCVWMHVITVRTSIHSRICQARDGQWLVYITDRSSYIWSRIVL
jgi:hypothetical protein